MFDWAFGVALLCVLVIFIAWNRLILVAAGHVVVTRGWNDQVRRVLKEGFHVLVPLEWAARYEWTFPNQEFGTTELSGCQIRTMGVQAIDMVPFECETADNTTVSVDTLLEYRVQNPEKAMMVAHNPLNLLCQQVIRSIRGGVVKYKRDALARNEQEIARAACVIIAKEWTPVYGLEVTRCEIQNISSDEDTIRRRRQFRDGLTFEERSRIEQAHALGGGTERRRTQVNL